jgi:hypothetical protein
MRVGTRRIVVVLAAVGALGVGSLAGVAVGAARLDPLLAPAVLGYAIQALATVAVVVTGLALLGRGRELGTAVLVSAGVLAIPSLMSLTAGLWLLGAGTAVALLVGAPYAVLATTAALAWTRRRPERWRWQASCSWPYLVVAAGLLVASWYPWVREPLFAAGPVGPGVASTFMGPGAGGLAQLTSFLGLATLLVGAARLARRLAAGLLVAVAAQVLPTALYAVQHALREGLMVTPFGWVALVSSSALTVTALWWRDAERRAEQERRDTLAQAAGLT